MPHSSQEFLVKGPTGHGTSARQVVNADRLVEMVPHVTKGAGNSVMIDGDEIAALAGDQSGDGNANRLLRGGSSIDQPLQQFGASVAAKFEIRVHAGNGSLHRIHGAK